MPMKLEDICDNIIGLVPEYSKTGDGCRLICRTADDGKMSSYYDSRTIESVKRQLAHCYALDLAAQGRQLQKEYQRTKPLPFYFSDERIFVPFKLRLARVAGDPSYGYIASNFVARVLPANNTRCRIDFINGESLPVFSNITTARLALYFATEIQKNSLRREADPDQELLQAFHTLRRYITTGNPQ